jgi:hypothetical protein
VCDHRRPALSVQGTKVCAALSYPRGEEAITIGAGSVKRPPVRCVYNFFAAAPKPLPYWASEETGACQIKQFLRPRRRPASARRDVLRANQQSDVGVRKASAYGSWADGAFPKHESLSLSASFAPLGIAKRCRHASCRQPVRHLFASSRPITPRSRSCPFRLLWPLQS